jgi:hypothetical protein
MPQGFVCVPEGLFLKKVLLVLFNYEREKKKEPEAR